MSQKFTVQPWLDTHLAHSTSVAKRSIYSVARPILSASHKRNLSRATLEELQPTWVLGSRGMPLEHRRRWAWKGIDIQEATVLVQGTGTGWDVVSWASLKPKRLIAVDLYEFTESWGQVADYCWAKFALKVEFVSADLTNLAFLSDGSVDLCASDAVLEHCRDLAAVAAEASRVLRTGGQLYASYGPLWFCAGGDHFSGRGGLNNVYNHLLLNDQQYAIYVEKYRHIKEDIQDGIRYIDLNLFSKLTTREFLRTFHEGELFVDQLILEVSKEALTFRRRFPSMFDMLVSKYAVRCDEDDFIIKSNLVKLVKSVKE